ncbi:unnamed protein product [Tenebrio molitor]|nr:unnamed protein product [Tenebrio molitor]
MRGSNGTGVIAVSSNKRDPVSVKENEKSKELLLCNHKK